MNEPIREEAITEAARKAYALAVQAEPLFNHAPVDEAQTLLGPIWTELQDRALPSIVAEFQLLADAIDRELPPGLPGTTARMWIAGAIADSLWDGLMREVA